MGLVPEFFVLLGISIFLAMSLLSHFLDDELPSRLQYMFQIAAGIGLGELIMSQTLTDLTRFWVSAIYLAFALSGVLGLNIYLVVVRRNMAIAPAFSGAVTAPILMTSGLFVYSFLGSAGEVGLALAAMVSLAILMSLTSLSIFGFLREVSKPTRSTHRDQPRRVQCLLLQGPRWQARLYRSLLWRAKSGKNLRKNHRGRNRTRKSSEASLISKTRKFAR